MEQKLDITALPVRLGFTLSPLTATLPSMPVGAARQGFARWKESANSPRESAKRRERSRNVAKRRELGRHPKTQLPQGVSGEIAVGWMVVRDGVDPSTSGFSDRRSSD
jgi:hypothetical protein